MIDNIFFKACDGDFEGVKNYILYADKETGKSHDINERESDGGTILHAAILGLHYNIVEFLLDHGANCNLYNEWGVTPLHRAILEGYTEERKIIGEKIALLLISHGSELFSYYKNEYNEMSLGVLYPFAKKRGYEEVVKIMEKRKATKIL